MMRTHDPLCALLKKEPCHGIGGADFGHYTDQPECRNCGARCDCARITEIRAGISDEVLAACGTKYPPCTRCLAYAAAVRSGVTKP